MTFEHFKTQLNVHKTDLTLLVRDKFCFRLIIYCFVLFRFAFHFSVLFSFFYHRGGDEQKVRFLTKCCSLLAFFLYGSIVLTILTALFFMWMFVIDQITTNFKALLRSSDTAIHFWTLNLIVATYTITDILMICKKTGDKKKTKTRTAATFKCI